MRIASLTLALLIVCTAAAQQRVRVGGGGGKAELTKDWPKLTPKPGASESEIVKTLGGYLDSLVQRDLFSGTVLLAREGKPVFFQSYGLANKDWSVPNANDTRYLIGSINKIFTMKALQQLRAEGKIDFSKTIRTYLPDYPNALADKVTIEQLMQHQSGMGDVFGEAFDATPKDRLRTLEDYLKLFADKPLEFEPGARQRYSNAGYVVLGLIIEKVSGTPYHDFVRTRIFAPLGMNDTSFDEVDAVVPRRATGYMRDGRTNVLTRPGRSSSAGGGYSTAADLLKFAEAERKSRGAGLGIAGGAPGMNAGLEVGEQGYTIIVLSNYDSPTAMEVLRNVRTLLGLGGE
ncbi:MAG TPA: serine hydrolase domain-containing protein [Thermoanaerobaculia bacterium]|nr:serine hydrolase domain-containing protein [Thermoanaerobaculia bacterium]